jgi:hypothetical protein
MLTAAKKQDVVDPRENCIEPEKMEHGGAYD